MISTLLTILLIIVSVVLVFLILVLQHGNEGGFGGALGGGNSSGFFGASGGVKGIVKATWICGILFFALALSTSWVRTHDRYALKNRLEKSLSAGSAPAKTAETMNNAPQVPLAPVAGPNSAPPAAAPRTDKPAAVPTTPTSKNP